MHWKSVSSIQSSLKRYYFLVCSISFYYHNFVYIVKKAFSCCCRQRKNIKQTVLSCEKAKEKTRKTKNTKCYGKFCCASLMCWPLQVEKWVYVYMKICGCVCVCALYKIEAEVIFEYPACILAVSCARRRKNRQSRP